MKLFVKLLSIVFLAMFFIGCVPKIKPIEPAVNGQIVDKQTNKPIEGVVVNESIKTDIDGKFKIEQKSELGISTTMGGNYMIKRTFTVKKDGYETLTCNCEVLVNGAVCDDVVIRLIKISKDNNSSFLKLIEAGYGLHCYE